jgi:hypothetical protein
MDYLGFIVAGNQYDLFIRNLFLKFLIKMFFDNFEDMAFEY